MKTCSQKTCMCSKQSYSQQPKYRGFLTDKQVKQNVVYSDNEILAGGKGLKQWCVPHMNESRNAQ